MARPSTQAILAAAALVVGAGVAAAQDGGDDLSPLEPRPDEPYVSDLLAPPAGGEPAPEGEAGAGGDASVEVSDYMTVDLFVQDEDLATVLQMLSMQSQRNIVASRDVVATVSANLYGVTFYEALDAILHVNGYGYIEKGSFIYVYPAEVIAQIQAEQRRMISKVITLNYLNANDAAEFVSPLLTPDAGQIKTNGDAGDFNLPSNTPTGNEEFALSSTLVLYDFPEVVEEIEELLDQLDTRPAQVLVEATILQTQLNEANAFGIDFAIIADVEFSDFFQLGGPLGSALSLGGTDANTAVDPGTRGTAIVSDPGNFDGPASFRAAIIQDDFSIFLRALDEVSDTTVLSSPKVLALNRQPARVLVGAKIGYLSTTATQTATTQSVEFLDTGTALNFRPFVSKDGMIRMELAPSVSEGFIRNSTDSAGNTITIPDEITQEITTNVLVPDGATIVLGGLFRENTQLSRTQVPVLGDIPLIGAAFKGHDDQIQRQEIIFLIKPTIMNDQVLLDQGDRALSYIEGLRAGSRQGLLPFSRERQTAQLNVQAERLAREGDYEEAMWCLRRSLELNPNQPDAIDLRERLFNQRDVWPSRSLLLETIDGEVEHMIFEKWPDLGDAGGAPPAHGAVGAMDDFVMPESYAVEVEPMDAADRWDHPAGVTQAKWGYDSMEAAFLGLMGLPVVPAGDAAAADPIATVPSEDGDE
jgi:type IV pilus assembly protein PilQ